jgi:uncharacterized protein
MSERSLPEQVDPFRYAEQGLALAGTLKVTDMARLSGNVLPSDARVKVDLQFGVDEQGTTFVKGHLSTKLLLQCQRCMGPFTYEIISDFALGIANTLDEADALPKHYEPVLTVAGQLALRDLVEDELILALPIVPKHALNDCKVKLPGSNIGEQEEDEQDNPFHVLKSLKHGK